LDHLLCWDFTWQSLLISGIISQEESKTPTPEKKRNPGSSPGFFILKKI
jgi:hypothetical protein